MEESGRACTGRGQASHLSLPTEVEAGRIRLREAVMNTVPATSHPGAPICLQWWDPESESRWSVVVAWLQE